MAEARLLRSKKDGTGTEVSLRKHDLAVFVFQGQSEKRTMEEALPGATQPQTGKRYWRTSEYIGGLTHHPKSSSETKSTAATLGTLSFAQSYPNKLGS